MFVFKKIDKSKLKSNKLYILFGLILIGFGFFNSSAMATIPGSKQDLLPKAFVEKYLADYSPQEIILINDDLDNINKLAFRHAKPVTQEQPVYIATAGGPGSSKSTLLEKYRLNLKNYVYLDPDQRVLKVMINTYLQEFSNDKISEAAIKTRTEWQDYLYKAYTKWRASSLYISWTLLNQAYGKGYNILHGTTSTSPQVADIFKNLKQKGYKIVLLLSYSTDDNRVKALQHRTDVLGFYRIVPEEIVSKGKAFPESFPIYFQYADEIQMYWVDNFLEGETLAAVLSKNSKTQSQDSKNINIHNASAFKKFNEKYAEDAKEKSLVSLDSLIQGFR